jgi:hypothetical protein
MTVNSQIVWYHNVNEIFSFFSNYIASTEYIPFDRELHFKFYTLESSGGSCFCLPKQIFISAIKRQNIFLKNIDENFSRFQNVLSMVHMPFNREFHPPKRGDRTYFYLYKNINTSIINSQNMLYKDIDEKFSGFESL